MRKHVTPADPGASIPDPERGCDLPPGGAPVAWNAYWAGLLIREDITAADLPEKPAEAPAAPDAAPQAALEAADAPPASRS